MKKGVSNKFAKCTRKKKKLVGISVFEVCNVIKIETPTMMKFAKSLGISLFVEHLR